jgi:hypothetical protein
MTSAIELTLPQLKRNAVEPSKPSSDEVGDGRAG